MYGALVGIAAVFGAVVGSFLNVVIHRVPRGESVVRPRSHCAQCGSAIRARHNIPIVSYLVLRARCADCAAPISPRYPLVELGTALLFAATLAWTLRDDRLPLLPALLYLGAIGIALALIDIDVHRLPNALVLPAYPVVAAFLLMASLWTGDWLALGRAAIGAGSLFAFYFLLATIYPAGMGFGDVKLAGVLGAILGYFGFAHLIVGAIAGFVLGSIVALVVIALRLATRKTALPFGPFMLLGCAVGIVAGAPIAHAYRMAAGV